MRPFVRHAPSRTGVGAAAAAALLALAVPAAHAAGGTVSGRVEATPAKFLEETVVYLKEVPGTFPGKAVSLDQRGMKFIPHVLVVTAGDTVEFLNHDTVAHNVFTPDNETYNLGTFKPDEKRTYTFKTPGVYTQLCSIHPEMLGFVFVGQNPYAAAVEHDGRFAIHDVPPGTYTIAVWNSHLKTADKKVTVVEGKTAEESFSLHR